MPDTMYQVHHSAMKASDSDFPLEQTEPLFSDDADEMKILLKAGVPLCAHSDIMEG